MIIDIKINGYFRERKDIMKNQMIKSTAKGVKKVLDVVLKTEANSTSCALVFQPKAPKELMKFRRNK